MAAIQELLSFKIGGLQQNSNPTDKWAGRSSLFTWGNSLDVANMAKFPAGMSPIVQAKLEQMGYKVIVLKKPLPTPLGPKDPVVDSFGNDPRYDFQMQVVDKLERFGQMIAQVSTGGGKSRIAKMAFTRIGRKTLFLTTRGILMYQMADAMFELIGEKNVGILGDGKWKTSPGFNVGMVQSFAAKLKLPDPSWPKAKIDAKMADIIATRKLLAEFEFVIIEEAHETSGNSFFDIMGLCLNAHYRLALTATPFMKSGEEANMRLMACAGPVAIKVSEKTLIERGILAKPMFKFVRTNDPVPECIVEKRDMANKRTDEFAKTILTRTTPWPKAYELGIVGGIKRNGMIVYEAMRAVKHRMSVMILVQHQDHGNRLRSMLTEAGVKCNFIFGDHEQDERKAALNALKLGKIDVLIGSTILDVGVDVPALGMVILAGAGKAEVALRQRIGRGLRAKKKGPNICYIVDFEDWQNNHLYKHFQERAAIVSATPGFAENVVKDFDFVGDGVGVGVGVSVSIAGENKVEAKIAA